MKTTIITVLILLFGGCVRNHETTIDRLKDICVENGGVWTIHGCRI